MQTATETFQEVLERHEREILKDIAEINETLSEGSLDPIDRREFNWTKDELTKDLQETRRHLALQRRIARTQ